MVTLKDVAKEAGVSYATVSRALNNHPEVNPNTRNKVLKIAEEMNYYPNAVARSLVNKQTNVIGLLIPDITNPFFPEVARGVEEAAIEYGYNVMLCNTNWNKEREDKYLNILLQNKVDGIIMTPSIERVNHLTKILDSEVETVFISSLIQHSKAVSVFVDNFLGARKAVQYLIDQGHEKIAFIGTGEERSANVVRFNGYLSTLKENGLKIYDKYILKEKGLYDRTKGYQAMKKLLNLEELPTALFTYNDLVALGAIQAIKEYNFSIPEDIAVIGFDDIPFSSLSEIQLSTVAQPKISLGKTAIKEIISQIENKDNQNIGKKIVLPPKLIIRGTS